VGTTRGRAELPREMQLAALLHHVERHRRAVEASARLGTAELRLLWLLRDGTPRTLRQVADELHLEQSTVNRQVNGALAAGHLRRSRQPGSSSYLFEPTDEGRAAFEHDTSTALGLFSDVLDELGPQDATRFLELLDRFVGLYGDAIATLPRS